MKNSASYQKIPSIHPKRGNITYVLFTASFNFPTKIPKRRQKNKPKNLPFFGRLMNKDF
ncbi:hypothetical protein B4092_4526 [Bacillus licheniformis]|nr:hypothetical protein B4092_4526 [Bacillus licheniformis]OLG05753.1 hypothetical protein B4124_1137 [Bacillus licheniformis]